MSVINAKQGRSLNSIERPTIPKLQDSPVRVEDAGSVSSYIPPHHDQTVAINSATTPKREQIINFYENIIKESCIDRGILFNSQRLFKALRKYNLNFPLNDNGHLKSFLKNLHYILKLCDNYKITSSNNITKLLLHSKTLYIRKELALSIIGLSYPQIKEFLMMEETYTLLKSHLHYPKSTFFPTSKEFAEFRLKTLQQQPIINLVDSPVSHEQSVFKNRVTTIAPHHPPPTIDNNKVQDLRVKVINNYKKTVRSICEERSIYPNTAIYLLNYITAIAIEGSPLNDPNNLIKFLNNLVCLCDSFNPYYSQYISPLIQKFFRRDAPLLDQKLINNFISLEPCYIENILSYKETYQMLSEKLNDIIENLLPTLKEIDDFRTTTLLFKNIRTKKIIKEAIKVGEYEEDEIDKIYNEFIQNCSMNSIYIDNNFIDYIIKLINNKDLEAIKAILRSASSVLKTLPSNNIFFDTGFMHETLKQRIKKSETLATNEKAINKSQKRKRSTGKETNGQTKKAKIHETDSSHDVTIVEKYPKLAKILLKNNDTQDPVANKESIQESLNQLPKKTTDEETNSQTKKAKIQQAEPFPPVTIFEQSSRLASILFENNDTQKSATNNENPKQLLDKFLKNKFVYKRYNSILEQLADLHKDLSLLDIKCIINKLAQADAPFNLKQKWYDLCKQKSAEENI